MLCRHEFEWEQSLLGGEFKGLFAIHDMPFKLTVAQVNTINSYLEEIAEGEMK